jgi:hypothetical protein
MGKRLEVFMEFLIFGIVMGVVEDLIAVTLITGSPVGWRGIFIIILVAIPFATIGELVIDRIEFLRKKTKK